jgi:hypothetical protein
MSFFQRKPVSDRQAAGKNSPKGQADLDRRLNWSGMRDTTTVQGPTSDKPQTMAPFWDVGTSRGAHDGLFTIRAHLKRIIGASNSPRLPRRNTAGVTKTTRPRSNEGMTVEQYQESPTSSSSTPSPPLHASGLSFTMLRVTSGQWFHESPAKPATTTVAFICEALIHSLTPQWSPEGREVILSIQVGREK